MNGISRCAPKHAETSSGCAAPFGPDAAERTCPLLFWEGRASIPVSINTDIQGVVGTMSAAALILWCCWRNLEWHRRTPLCCLKMGGWKDWSQPAQYEPAQYFGILTRHKEAYTAISSWPSGFENLAMWASLQRACHLEIMQHWKKRLFQYALKHWVFLQKLWLACAEGNAVPWSVDLPSFTWTTFN